MRHYLACQEGLAGATHSGGTTKLVARQFLHAHRLTFRLLSGEERTFTSPLPDDLEKPLQKLDNTIE